MPPSILTPVIVGVGDIKNRSIALEDAKEPATLIHEAILAAAQDASAVDASKLQAAIDSIDVVRTWTWPYPDLPGLLAKKLGVRKGLKRGFYSEHGGDKPGKLLDAAARRVANGEVKVTVVAGGEALASLTACAAAKRLPPPGWTTPAEAVDSVFTPTGRDYGTNLGGIHDLGAPIHIYPLYENAFRAHRGQSIKENHEESAKLYAEFSKVAEKNPYAWNCGKYDDEKVIGTVSKKNRMIGFPYPLLMNAFNTVNLAAACILTSTSHARTLGIPESKWIYPLGGAGTSDSEYFWHRPNFYSSPSISQSLDATLAITNLSKDDIDLYDFYSCFPIVPKLAAMHLGLPITGGEKSLTLLGGLTSFGGAGNNYSMHALTEMTRKIRAGKGKRGLVLSNGGWLSYQYVVILSKEPRRDGGYPGKNPLPEHTNVPAPEIDEEAEGEGVVETYTIAYARDGPPSKGHIVGRLKSSGKRFLANHGDESTLRQMAGGAVEIVGKTGWVWQDREKKGRGLFSFEKGPKM
ncbi:acetyl-CoA acetyltransferas-like protein [Lentithecium fluviatile CBS 122367]|uniref:Acetyl-CoA acetyltransferas-like protein n=1 Tax=Lentithecium fluviatile CBS 122367 TaxID=1168545 RepID=A0A6G1IN18_9PLEO|nr:acetyl-CoA acetyltransferas-like protein [Lentithecium fluviatile CBS 122367]